MDVVQEAVLVFLFAAGVEAKGLAGVFDFGGVELAAE